MDLVAPGVSIYSTNIGGGYTYRNGTSMAAPFVAGLAAILRGMPGSSAGTVRTIMEGTALDLGPAGWDNSYGNGLIQMDSAILLALPATRTPRLPTHTPQVFLPGGFLPTFTLTPSPTLPLTLPVSASPSITPSQTLDSSANPGDLDTMTPEIIALETQTPRGSAFGRELLFPSCGLLLLLAGLLLFWFGSRGRKKPHRGSYL
jgi:subtilisin family serine protease